MIADLLVLYLVFVDLADRRPQAIVERENFAASVFGILFVFTGVPVGGSERPIPLLTIQWCSASMRDTSAGG